MVALRQEAPTNEKLQSGLRPAPPARRRLRRPVTWDSRPRLAPPKQIGAVRVRRDTLPEHTPYRDSGCDLAPSCLRCPLARCQFDVPGGAEKLLAERRDREITLLRRRHRAPIDMLAETYGLSRRSIFRILRAHG